MRTGAVPNRILQAAIGILAEHGVGDLTQPKVARAAGIRQSHLTYYFPTRADLLLAVATHSVEAMANNLDQGIRDGTLTAHGLAGALFTAASDKRRARILVGLAITAIEDVQVRERFRQFVASVRERIRALLGLIGIELDASALAAFHSTLVGATLLNLARDDAASRRELKRVIATAVERLPRHPAAPAASRRRRT